MSVTWGIGAGHQIPRNPRGEGKQHPQVGLLNRNGYLVWQSQHRGWPSKPQIWCSQRLGVGDTCLSLQSARGPRQEWACHLSGYPLRIRARDSKDTGPSMPKPLCAARQRAFLGGRGSVGGCPRALWVRKSTFKAHVREEGGRICSREINASLRGQACVL